MIVEFFLLTGILIYDNLYKVTKKTSIIFI